MGLFGPEPRKRRTKRQILNGLNARLNKKARAQKKRSDKAKLQTQIDAARKKLRGY